MEKEQSASGSLRLVEVLVLAVVAVTLLWFLLPGVQRCHISSTRTQTLNNLKQVALACHAVDATYKRLPPASGPYGVLEVDQSLSVHLLPFVEQDPLYKQIVNRHATLTADDAESRKVIASFLSMGDPSPHTGEGVQNMAGNIRVFTDDGHNAAYDADVIYTSAKLNASLTRHIPDGTSNVILFATRYAHNRETFPTKGPECSPYFALWDNSPTRGSAFFGRPHALKPAQAKAEGIPTFQLTPTVKQAHCTQAGFAHADISAGLLVALADATTRCIAPGISPETWNRALQPNDGKDLGSEWQP